MTQHKSIIIKGARLHNLKNIDIEIPRNRITVITGVSGSGKSSLAFDTLYAEGQRRFVESLSAYARQFLERMTKPDVDSILGLPPAVAIEQKPPGRNPRSTVGTTTEIYDYLRIIFGRIGKTYCRNCGKLVRRDYPTGVVKELQELPEGAKLYILFPISPKARSLSVELDRFRELGFFRVVLEGSSEIINLENEELPKKTEIDKVFVLADRIALRHDQESITRLTESIESAFANGGGKILIQNLNDGGYLKYSSTYECSDCEIVYAEPDPKIFSFNNPHGACSHCQGFGRTIGIDENLIIPDRSRTLRQGAIHPFRTPSFSKYQKELESVAKRYDVPLDVPVANLTEEQWKVVNEGAPGYIGVDGFFQMLEDKNYKMHYRIMMAKYRGYTKCKACGGSRLRTSARQAFIGGKNIPEVVLMPLDRCREFFDNLTLDEYETQIAGQVLEEIRRRLGMLVDIGLEYLTLSRLTQTLSGGESQRINLSTALGSSLVGTLYVLDEPSVGLHPRDTNKLINILFKLRNLGNTIVVVEHDPDIIRHADYIIDMGPRAGEYGGEVMFEGSYPELIEHGHSLTAEYFSGRREIPIPEKRRKPKSEKITILHPRQNNLKIDKVEFPLGCLCVVTGVSGSGKSTLVHNILYAGLRKQRGIADSNAGIYEKISGGEDIEAIELVDQTSIGKTSRSTPATYTKVFDAIRELFASTQAARQLGWKPGYFSFNVPGGRCEVCEGEGSVTVDMQFLPDVKLECDACHGTRYKREAQGVHYKGKSIVDVLDMTIDEAAQFFAESTKITKRLAILQDVGLGYLRLGQPSTMLSGGESQRIKLAGHLDQDAESNSLFIFDEPTTGLHVDDISKLLLCFNRLVDKGNSVIIIEHNVHVMASADWIIDLGPEAGERGGELVVVGPPEKVAKHKFSHTAKALREHFETLLVVEK